MNHRPHMLAVEIAPAQSGAVHMARDAALLAAQGPEDPPVLRLYSWSPPAVSLGFMQVAADLLDLDTCRAAGIDVVQRPTGGRAVLHWEEITYAIVGGVRDARFGADLASAHACIGACLVAGLDRLGVQAVLSRPALDPERRLLRQPCFVSPGRAELLAGGRKLVGNAQRRTRSAFLQHGSLLVGRAHERLVEFLRDTRADPKLAAAMRARLQRETVTLEELLGRAPGFDALADALVDGFATTLGLTPVAVTAPAGPSR